MQKSKFYTSSKIEKIDGQPGDFDVTISTNGSQETIKIGAIIQATGWKPYDAKKLGKNMDMENLKMLLPTLILKISMKQNEPLPD